MSTESLTKVQHVIKAIEEVRVEANCKNIITVDLLMLILEVGKGQGVTGRDAEDLLGIGASKAHRLLDSLRTEQRNGARGYGLVEERPCKDDYRSIKRYPNARCRKLIETIENYIG